MSDLLQMYKQPKNEKRDRDIQVKVHGLSKVLPEPMKAQEFLKKLSLQLGTDNVLLSSFEKVVDPDVSCKDCQLYVVSTRIILLYYLPGLGMIQVLQQFFLESNSKENGLSYHDKSILWHG